MWDPGQVSDHSEPPHGAMGVILVPARWGYWGSHEIKGEEHFALDLAK